MPGRIGRADRAPEYNRERRIEVHPMASGRSMLCLDDDCLAVERPQRQIEEIAHRYARWPRAVTWSQSGVES